MYISNVPTGVYLRTADPAVAAPDLAPDDQLVELRVDVGQLQVVTTGRQGSGVCHADFHHPSEALL